MYGLQAGVEIRNWWDKINLIAEKDIQTEIFL